MSFHTRILSAILALPVLPLVSASQDAVHSDKVSVHTQVSHEQARMQLNKGDQNKTMELHSYLEEPLDQLLKRIPELQGISPAADQHQLSMILRRTGAAVDEFFANMVDLIAHEDIIQERLVSGAVNGGMPGGLIESKARVRDSYLIVRQADGDRTEVDEFRMNDKGMRIDEAGPDKGFVTTSGFALGIVHFSSVIQWDSRFLHLGDQKIGAKETYVIAFAQLPGEARNTVTMQAEGVKLKNLFVQGIAWVDKTNFQIVQMRTELLAPQPDIGLDEQTTEIRFGEVRFADLAVPLWLPRDVNVYMKFSAGALIEIFRNVHHYTDYRRYRVSTKILAPN